jgi:hypothetical protein
MDGKPGQKAFDINQAMVSEMVDQCMTDRLALWTKGSDRRVDQPKDHN